MEGGEARNRGVITKHSKGDKLRGSYTILKYIVYSKILNIFEVLYIPTCRYTILEENRSIIYG